MLLANLGYTTLLLALVSAAFAPIAAIYGTRTRQPRWVAVALNANLIILPLVLTAALILVTLLVTNNFAVAYVADTTSRETPLYLKITALWGSQDGSLLFWNLLLALFTATALRRKWQSQPTLIPYAIAVASTTQFFFLFLSAILENPFMLTANVPLDGRGLNPLLRHFGMIIHPPTLYLGFVGFTIPYSFAMAALITGKLDDDWIHTTRRWTLAAWLFLSLGLILGGRWAYDVLGWGGYWGWDPVENASLMPWLAGTAFLHSVMIQEKRSMFKMWNMFLVILTFLLVISGTFIVRSGLVSSVHTFAQSNIGWFFFVYIAITVIFTVYWVLKRRPLLQSRQQLHSLWSREAAFLFNNFIILGILVGVLIGVYFPVLTELLGQKRTVGAPYYEMVTGPLFALLVALMGIAPLTMWHRTHLSTLGRSVRLPALLVTIAIAISAFWIRKPLALVGLWAVSFSAMLTLLEFHKGAWARHKKGEMYLVALGRLFQRNQRRYGGYLIHLGVIIMGFGIIGIEFFQQERQRHLNIGEALTIGPYELVFQGATQFPSTDDLLVTETVLELYRGDTLLTTLRPHVELYQRTGQPMTIPAMRSTFLEDLYVIAVNWEGVTATSATFKAYINPLINWVWAGGIIFAAGTAIAGWPMVVRQPATKREWAIGD